MEQLLKNTGDAVARCRRLALVGNTAMCSIFSLRGLSCQGLDVPPLLGHSDRFFVSKQRRQIAWVMGLGGGGNDSACDFRVCRRRFCGGSFCERADFQKGAVSVA